MMTKKVSSPKAPTKAANTRSDGITFDIAERVPAARMILKLLLTRGFRFRTHGARDGEVAI